MGNNKSKWGGKRGVGREENLEIPDGGNQGVASSAACALFPSPLMCVSLLPTAHSFFLSWRGVRSPHTH